MAAIRKRTSIKKSAKDAYERTRDTAARVGKAAGSAAAAAVKAGTTAALVAGTAEMAKGWKESSPEEVRKRNRKKVAAAIAGVAALGVAGAAIAKARKK